MPPGWLRQELEIVNRIREERKRWRADGYPGATGVNPPARPRAAPEGGRTARPLWRRWGVFIAAVHYFTSI